MTRCKDCQAAGIQTARSAPHPGPRCFTHHRTNQKRQRAQAHARRIETTYGIPIDDYWRIYEAQGQRCAICQRATGKARRLAVDHEHRRPGCEHTPERGCPACVRGLICKFCNEAIGRLDLAALKRAVDYLENPPAHRLENRNA